MNKMKRILSLALVLTLAVVLAVPAFAATARQDGKITVQNPLSEYTYELYRIFNLDDTYNGDSYPYHVNDQWAGFFEDSGEGKNWFTVDPDSKTVAWKPGVEQTGATMQEFASAAKRYAKDHAIAAEASLTAAKTEQPEPLEFSGLKLGYYLVVSKAPNGAAEGSDKFCALATADHEVTVLEKNEVPSIPGGKTADKETAAINEVVTFTIPIEKGGIAWDDYTVVDNMKGLQFIPDSVTVEKDGVGLDPNTEYEVKAEPYDPTSKTQTLRIILKKDLLDRIHPNETVIITYQAKATQVKVMNNKAHIEYMNGPSGSGTLSNTPETDIPLVNFEFTLNKQNKDGQQLEGAEFELRDFENRPITFDVKGSVYTADKEAKETKITAGNVTIQGLAEGTYYLHETKAPAGYNKLVEDIEIRIIAGDPVAEKNPDGTWQRTPPTIEMDSTQITEGEAGNFVLNVINNVGSKLPSTGGIGTTIFYVIGGLLMAAAVVALIVKKRMER